MESHHAIQPTIQIGKSGLTEEVIEEIKRQVKQRKVIKVKFLKSFVEENDKKKAALEIAEKTNSRLVHQVGFIVVLAKKGIKNV